MTEKLRRQILDSLKQVPDPELHVNIVDLGLVYGFDLDKNGLLEITMTLTTPGCPLTPVFEAMIRSKLKRIREIRDIKINLTFDPPWDVSKMSPGVRTALGF